MLIKPVLSRKTGWGSHIDLNALCDRAVNVYYCAICWSCLAKESLSTLEQALTLQF